MTGHISDSDPLPPIDAFNRHEVLHTASVIADMFDRHIEQHRYTASEPELAEAAAEIGERLSAFYQLVGAMSFPGPGE